MMKKLVPVRLLKNSFFQKVKEAEDRCASREELMEILGRARAKKGMFEGDLDEGELEIGQASGYINQIKPAAAIVKEMMEEFETARTELKKLRFKNM
jgi:enoyl-[acyl-carrier protein] reductase II